MNAKDAYQNTLWNKRPYDLKKSIFTATENGEFSAVRKITDKDDKEEVIKWIYYFTPNLYHFDTKWHVSWIHCSDGFAFIDFEGETIEEVIQKAFDWCVKLNLV